MKYLMLRAGLDLGKVTYTDPRHDARIAWSVNNVYITYE